MHFNIIRRNASELPDPLQRRLANVSSSSEIHGAASAEEVALRSEARERLKAGYQDNRRASRRPGADGGARAQSSKSWPLWAVFDILLLLLIVPLVVSVPPVLDCRRVHQDIGFFAENSFEKCARKGISERWEILDNRLKMLVRGSGQ
ncbi:MAG: hypothetical protein K2Y56_02685 [Methylobacterium sp.]|uniref:hypothetical protein n=1 Tax=Methylobacterium sp. TaxID=409 RepID=UPI0025ED3C70|nr:hypothetical protein [Methylobacterium sp.]MBX9930438.1 hypothetical protein [Methylobacterium sp.]